MREFGCCCKSSIEERFNLSKRRQLSPPFSAFSLTTPPISSPKSRNISGQLKHESWRKYFRSQHSNAKSHSISISRPSTHVAIVIGRCNEALRRWKHRLKACYVDSKAPLEKMPYEDSQVPKDEWDVNYVTSEDFKEKSAKAKESKSHDKYPRHMGRSTYAEREIGWAEEGLYSSASAASSTSTISSLSPRTINWMQARKKKDENGNWIVPNEKTREVVKEIESWEEKVKIGEFKPHRTDDALNLCHQLKLSSAYLGVPDGGNK